MQRRVSRCDMTSPKLKQLAKPLPRHPSQSSSPQCRPSPAVSAVSAKSRRGRVPAEPRLSAPTRHHNARPFLWLVPAASLGLLLASSLGPASCLLPRPCLPRPPQSAGHVINGEQLVLFSDAPCTHHVIQPAPRRSASRSEKNPAGSSCPAQRKNIQRVRSPSRVSGQKNSTFVFDVGLFPCVVPFPSFLNLRKGAVSAAVFI